MLTNLLARILWAINKAINPFAAKLAYAMPSPAVTSPPAGRTPQGAPQGRGVVPFIRATKKHREPFFDQTNNPSTTLSPINIPAYGFLRGLWLKVEAVGGTGAAATYGIDAPFNVLTFLGLFDVNGAPLYGPFTSGLQAYLIGKYGAYHRYYDARVNDSTFPTTGNFSFWIYIPVEIVRRNALGALANLNAAATYKLQISLNSIAGTYTVVPTTGPTGFRIRIWLDAWAQPPATDLLGNMTAQTPLAHGTTQFWSEQVYVIGAGAQTVRLLRVGLYIRMLILTVRQTTGARFITSQAVSDAMWPDPVQVFLDGFEMVNISQNFLWNEMYSLYNVVPGAIDGATANISNRDTGVYVFGFVDDDGSVLGNEQRNRYLPTLQSSRLEVRGVFGANATSLSVLTNDIAPAGDIFVQSTDNATV
jgi:hypothetical protein